MGTHLTHLVWLRHCLTADVPKLSGVRQRNAMRWWSRNDYVMLTWTDEILQFTEPVVLICKKLDSLRWFSQRRSSTPHFWGCAPRGLWSANSNSEEIFVQCTYPQVSSPYVCSFGSYHVGKNRQTNRHTHKQTNRHRWKHPTLFATLRRWVIKQY